MATTPTPPQSSLPQPLSYEQILGQQLSSYAATTGINDLNTGSVNISFMQLAALMVSRASGDIFQVLRDSSLDRATGPALQNLAIGYGVPPIGAKTATGFVTVVDLSFQKISTKIYAGTQPPIAGSTTIYISDGSLFPPTGQVYIGRGTVNIEGPLSYTAVTAVGSYYSLTLSTPTTKYHNISESVILAQGGVRTVPINTIVVSPGVGTTATIQYSTIQVGTILDGETTVTNIPITALLPGASGNVPANAISQFSGNPAGLPNASVTNPLPLTTGADTETDDQLRIRVKNALASTGLGTVTAIESALQGVQDPNSSATIVSTDILNSSSDTIVYIDDGTGYEATHTGVAIETIVNSALGGEKFFQLITGGTQTSVTKALLQTVAAEPFALFGGEVLAVVVGDITYEHTFLSTDFANPGSATAYEVSASLNGDTLLNYEAVTASGGTYVVIRPEDEITNVIQMTTPADPTVTDANTILQFPSQKAETLRLFQNGKLLIEDGTTASIFTQPQSLWSSIIANGETLSLAIDGTAPITFTLTNAMFVAEGTYTTISYSNSLQSWVNVLNANITGITASIVGSTIELTSNLGPIDRAQITVVNTVATPTSLIAKGFISNTDLTSTGVASQYILDRNTAQIQLINALVKGDSLSAGWLVTEANVETNAIPSGSVTLTAPAHVWIAIDTDTLIIPTIQSGSTLTVSQIAPNIVRYTSNSLTSFLNVVVDDYVIIWCPQIPTSDQLEGRVHAVTGSTLDIKVTAAEYAAVTPVSDAAFISGFVVVRTANVPQKFEVATGTTTLYDISAELQTQTDQLTFAVVDGTNITATTNTLDVSGQVAIITADTQGALIGFVGGVNSVSQDALQAFYQTEATQSELPLFFHSTISADSYAEPPDSFVTSFTSTLPVSQFDPNELCTFLNPYGVYPTASGTLTLITGTGDATITFTSFTLSGAPNQYTFTVTSANATAGAIYSNNTQFFTVVNTIVAGTTLVATSAGLINDEQPSAETVQMNAVAGDVITILPEYPDVRRLRVNDRFFVANPLDFGYNDTVVAIVDNNVLGETYTMPLYRQALVNSTYAENNYSFNAYDVSTGPTASFQTNFGTPSLPTEFDFSNYKVLMQAKRVVSESNPNTSLLYRSVPWGRSGTSIYISYINPTAPNQPVSSVIDVSDVVNIQITLQSGNALATTIAANTQWNVSITSNTPVAGIDQVTYSYAANQYIFTTSPANATVGATYTNNGQTFTVSTTIAGATTLVTTGTGAPLSSGTLTKASGTGDTTITYTLVTLPGTAPNLPGSLSAGAFVTILPSTGFFTRNTGTFKISMSAGFTPTTTSFSVQVPTGTAQAQIGAVTQVPAGMSFYVATPTTAAQVNTYVNASLAPYITTTIVNGDGSGVLTTSTYEDSNFSTVSYQLLDGINWLASSNVDGSPQFTFKEPLVYPTSASHGDEPGYSFFVPGDTVRLIPTTMDQVKDLWNILAVTGFTTVGTIETSDRGTKLQLATNTIGSVGSIQIVGGAGNEYVVPILTSGNLVGDGEMSVSANSIASQAVSSDQWFKLQALNYQNKNTGIASNTSVNVLSNTPIAGESTVTLLNQTANQLYFGGPRNFTRIEGDTFRIEKQGLLACLSWNGVGSNPMFSNAVNFNSGGAYTVNVAFDGATATYTIASGATNFAGLSIGDSVTTSGFVNGTNNGTFTVEGVNGTSFSVSNPEAASETGTAGTPTMFVSTVSVSEGDTVILASPFSPLNQGQYRVIRMAENSIWYENANAILEEVVCNANTVSTGYDASTVFNLTAVNGSSTLSWTGVGTPPALQNVIPGDIVTFSTGFASNNQGSFMATGSGSLQQQVVQFTMPAGSTFSSSGPGDYFEIYNGGNVDKYYIWYNVGGANSDPAPGGFTGIEVAINSTDPAGGVGSVATKTNTALTALVAMTSTVNNNIVTVTATVAAQTNSPVDISMPIAFSFTITQTGQEPFFTVINPSGSTQDGISAVTFIVNRPQIQFFQYEATVPGDKLAVSGAVLGLGNAGNYKILQVLSPSTVVVAGIISQQFNNNLGGNYLSLQVQEGTAYTGYKQVAFVSMQPGSSNFNDIVFNTDAQYEKINLSANIGMTSLGKLNFPTTIRIGIDAYNYDTGLIGQANRVVYGDPRDQITYPGVNAAGTDIYIREPLLRRIQISLGIRTNIGVSFTQITNQIQSSVYSLIQSNPLGQSIFLSTIIETVQEVPGVTSVVLISPTDTVASDFIQLVTGEKAFIVSPATDISVSLIGSV